MCCAIYALSIPADMVVTGSRDGSIMLWDVRCTGVEMETGGECYWNSILRR